MKKGLQIHYLNNMENEITDSDQLMMAYEYLGIFPIKALKYHHPIDQALLLWIFHLNQREQAVSKSKLAEYCDLSRPTVIRHLRQLEKDGYLAVSEPNEDNPWNVPDYEVYVDPHNPGI